MSDNFPGESNAKLSDSTESVDYFKTLNDSDSIDDLSLPYDHMYASSNSTENGLVNTTDPATCQTAESEVKFLKEWLVLHLDLIQQQNDEILSKEKTIFVLQQENEMLKERINCMERGTPFHSNKFLTIHKSPEIISEAFSEDMTQDLGSTGDNNDNVDVGEINIDSSTNPKNIECEEEENLLINNTAIRLNNIECSNIESNLLEKNIKFNDIKPPSESIEEFLNSSHSSSKFKDGYSIHNNVSGVDSMRNLKMSIRRKRLCSNSSAFSNNDSASEEKRNYRKSRKKRKHVVKNEQILTTCEQYVTHVGENTLNIINPAELGVVEETALSSTTTLEVPRWRIKSYTSCYTMEGTENLDDDVYNRRHSRLENDERRRKRWDVQRIREQRLIEKLKQRQDKIGTNSRSDDQTESSQSFWPCVDEIKFLEVCDNLPVSAFGCPIPKLQPSEFNLPWLNNPTSTLRKAPTRKSTGRRRGSKR